MSMSDLVSIQALETLLAPNSDDLTDDVSQPSPGTATLTPAHIIPMKKQQSRDSVMKPSNEKAIWNEEEVREEMEFDDVGDDRKKPDYEILFKQRVGTEDLFLCLNRKDVSTACCEDMLIRVKLPGSQMAEMNLDVKDHFLDLRTPEYKLGLHLPHKVRSKDGRAHLLPDGETLQVTLPMQRDYDFINFP
uniref:dynein axonemal assembly factor 6-like isoform X1 n=1 Tax=Myxine glutinosa TaxID=7769 RepID=UPI00358F4A01